MNIKQWLYKVSLFKKKNPFIFKEAFILLKYILKKDYSWIITFDNYKFKNQELEKLDFYLFKILKGEPFSYVIKKHFFRSFSIKIYPDIFIPRQDTEIMVEYTINLVKKKKFLILDLGTGSGVISLSLAQECINALIVGIDINPLAINLAKYNSYKLGLKNVFFYESNWFTYFKNKKKKFNLIISNPPYINLNYQLSNNLKFESYISLKSFKGINDIYHIIKNSYFFLKKHGWLIIEHSNDQKNIINYIYKKYSYINISSYKNYNDLYRFSVAQKK